MQEINKSLTVENQYMLNRGITANDFLNLKRILENAEIPQSYVYNHLGMARSTWNRKLKTHSFTFVEAINICNLLNLQLQF